MMDEVIMGVPFYTFSYVTDLKSDFNFTIILLYNPELYS